MSKPDGQAAASSRLSLPFVAPPFVYVLLDRSFGLQLCTCDSNSLLHMPAAHACCTYLLLHMPAAHACCTCLLLTPVAHWQVRSLRSIGALTSPSTWRCVAPHPAHIRTLPSPPRPPPAGAKPPAGLQVAGAKGKVRLWDSLSALAVRRRFEGLAPALAARKGRRLPTTVAGMD